MPGKQVGMSDLCYPDSLIGGIPNIYYYAANNPSEATIAKRRSYANTISCEPGTCWHLLAPCPYYLPPLQDEGRSKNIHEIIGNA